MYFIVLSSIMAQLFLECVLQVDGVQPAFGEQIPHQSRCAIWIADAGHQGVPNFTLVHAHLRSHLKCPLKHGVL